MKSSTLHRSNLTKERMELLREIKSQKKLSNDVTPGIYMRPSKEKELDLLWQTFKVNQKEEKSPVVYLIAGFLVGALAMFLMTAVISFTASIGNTANYSFEPVKKEKVKINKEKTSEISFLPPDAPVVQTVVPPKSESYTVQSGDTLDRIVIRFFGKYDVAKIEAISLANNLNNPNDLRIGQVLTIPLD